MKRKIAAAVLCSMALTASSVGADTAAAGFTRLSAQTAADSLQSDSTTSDTAQTDSTKSTTPPAKPDGEADGSAQGDTNTPDGSGETPPAKPDGEADGSAPGDANAPGGASLPGGSGETPPAKPDGETGGNAQGGGMGGPGGSQEIDQGSAATTISEDCTVSDETYTSSGDNENALRVDGASVTLDGVTVQKTGGASSNAENGDFYGVNAGLLATNGADVTITNAEIETSAQNGNGVFSYGNGTTVTISDSVITTTADNSGGIQTTGGGTTIASDLTVTTSGSSAAAIRSDRGGGIVDVDGGTYTSNGYNSPAVYSTAEISVANAELTANNSEAIVIEGQNSVSLTNCIVSGNMSDDKGSSSDINVHNVMIYQSMSGDAEEGTSAFSMDGGVLTARNGDMFYVTNTACTIDLKNVTIMTEDDDANLMTITGNDASHGWGTAGANGGEVVMTCSGQTLEGDIVVDSISVLDLTLSDSSELIGTVNIVENAEGGAAASAGSHDKSDHGDMPGNGGKPDNGEMPNNENAESAPSNVEEMSEDADSTDISLENAVITIDAGSTWTLTGDCVITSLNGEGTINFNGYTITLADGTVLSEQ